MWWLTYSISHIQTWPVFRGIVEERSRFSSFAKLFKSWTWRQAERSREADTLWRKSVDYFAKGLRKKPRFSDGKTSSSLTLWFARWKTLCGQTFSKSSIRKVKLEKPTASSGFIRKSKLLSCFSKICRFFIWYPFSDFVLYFVPQVLVIYNSVRRSIPVLIADLPH